jgi:uncharacterized membrane protein
MNENTNIIAVYHSHEGAEDAVRRLHDAGFDMNDLSVVGQDYQVEERPVGFVNTGDRMWSWGKFGAFWGAVWGLLFGSAMLVVPGIGHVMFAGWLVAALHGAAIGAGFGVLGGALASIGIPENSVLEYEAEIKAGKFLLLARGSGAAIELAKSILGGTDATRVDAFEAREPVGHHH